MDSAAQDDPIQEAQDLQTPNQADASAADAVPEAPAPKASSPADPDPDDSAQAYGEIVHILIKDGLLTEQQVTYARRVHAKLEFAKPLLEVIKTLDFVSDEQIRQAIRNNRLSMRIGNLLVELGYLTQDDLELAFSIQKEQKTSRKLGQILIEQHLIEERTLVEALSLQMGFPFVEPEFTGVDRQLFFRAPLKWYERHDIIPIRSENKQVLVAFADPLDPKEIDAAQQLFGADLLPGIALRKEIRKAIAKAISSPHESERVTMDDDSVVGIANQIIYEAIKDGASDIHIEPLADRLRVRYRMDGVLVHYKDFSIELMPPILSRLKVLCNADISERRRHQGGRMQFVFDGEELDLRVSIYATISGEKIVMRVLNRQTSLLPLKKLGMPPRMLERYVREALEAPSGVVLITGPTGSGKTTTVYSCINYLNSPEISIITAEEPVEYVIDGIGQCSINPRINLTFEETLRHIVRQDPDIIVIGEIRDNYSAEIAVQSALTGHKVLTTFHTEDSIGGLVRLLNMDIEAFLISSTVISVVAQRLVRRICPACAQPYKPTPGDLQRIGYGPNDILGGNFQKGRGCTQCRHSGYAGRVGIYELLILDETVRDALLLRKTSHEIRTLSIESSGLVTLMEEGIVKAASGLTTIDEVLRCLPRTQRPRPLGELRRLLGD
jgi:type IV pilus assembly protein PilB